MGFSNVDLSILELYDSNLVNVFSMNEISKRLGKPYPYINKKVNAMISSGVLKRISIGRSHLCSINFDNSTALLMLSLMEARKPYSAKSTEASEQLEAFLRKRASALTICCALYSSEHLIFVVWDLHHRLEIQKHYPQSIILSLEEFINYLTETESIFKNHKVVYGYESFFQLVREALPTLQAKHSPFR
ncbi:MAG: hypothetical protein QXK37_01925, partial [Candidatus Woesearchaeota archaeon]